MTKPEIRYDKNIDNYYLNFKSGINDTLQSRNGISLPSEFTLFFVVKISLTDDKTYFDFKNNSKHFSMRIAPNNNTVIILNSISDAIYDVLKKENEPNLTNKIELWTIRVKNNSSNNLRKMDLYRGISSLTPIHSINIQHIISGDLFLSLSYIMDFYLLLVYKIPINNLFLHTFFQYFKNIYKL